MHLGLQFRPWTRYDCELADTSQAPIIVLEADRCRGVVWITCELSCGTSRFPVPLWARGTVESWESPGVSAGVCTLAGEKSDLALGEISKSWARVTSTVMPWSPLSGVRWAALSLLVVFVALAPSTLPN